MERVALEDRERSGDQSKLAPREVIRFDSLRDDWVRGADVIVRLVAKSVQAGLVLQGFPKQWIPLFIHFGAHWIDASSAPDYTPLASELSNKQVERLSFAARERGALREMVEA